MPYALASARLVADCSEGRGALQRGHHAGLTKP